MSESMTVEQARADFETWISKPPFEYSTARFGNGEYVYATVGFAWKAWQEAQAKMQARVAELEAICDNVPEGCTPADARVLREANHKLADEVEIQKEHVKKFAALAEANADLCDRVTKERDQLLVSLGKPEEITSPPHEDYDCLKKQYLALRSLANGRCRLASYWSDQCQKMTRDLLLTKGGIIDAERNTNAMLTDQLLQAEQERDGLKSALVIAEGLAKQNKEMAENFIALKQARDELRRRVDELEKQNDELAAKLKTVIDCGDSCCDEYCKDEWDLAVNAAADKTLARIKAAAVREAAMQWDSDPAKDYDNVRADLLEYANQIEGGA